MSTGFCGGLFRIENRDARLVPLTEIRTLFFEDFFRVVFGTLFRDLGVEEVTHSAHVQADRTGRAFILPVNRQRQF